MLKICTAVGKDETPMCHTTHSSIPDFTAVGLNDKQLELTVTVMELDALPPGISVFADAGHAGESQYYGAGKYKDLGS